ncbi:MAG: hypothetical protein HRT44_08235 [Bdellovibrionales bacterium]|nr:hypothetical protein [Bdellovibrionales bacterium]NQZ19227.1 hypothetical protein [Bdellovibrionales bacterium]
MKLLFVILLITLSPEVFANDHDHNHDHEHNLNDPNEEIRILQELNLAGGSTAYVVARQQGHILGQNYQVELRLNCSPEKKDIHDLPVHDSLSVCDVDPDSLKLNRKKTAVAMKSKMADMKTYYDQIEKGDRLAQVQCAKKTEVIKFSLSKLCR